ncbi:zinc finger CCCH domain-containing protein 31-like [Tasmannia lanceolata]|uniref:zinc finger CCCH domain-containing protein 31-like n=1 Tax=Tasmannia lanceolata TaxID=3420 RepID=UPI0040634E88
MAMDSFGSARKKNKSEGGFNANGGFTGSKRIKQEMESFSTGIGSKSKPCTKFFSTAGCPFGEGCHFLHYVPGGVNAVAQMTNLPNPSHPMPSRNPVAPSSFSDSSSSPTVKTKMCNKYNSAEGCKFGDKCHFAHGERELGRPIAPSHEDRPMGRMAGRFAGRLEPPTPNQGSAGSFGASATAKISVDASLAGAIIGKGGINSKQICRVTGAKLAIREHESDPNLKNIELEGTFDQIKQASTLVRELIVSIGTATFPAKTPVAAPAAAANNYKTKLCENFAKGTCTFGERCHFAHGASDLRKQGM